MGNSRTRTINYRPRYSQMDAYDLLPQPIRDALKEGPQEWDTNSLLRNYRKFRKTMSRNETIRAIVAGINEAHASVITEGRKDWVTRKPGQKWASLPDSPHNEARATMQTAGY